MEEVTKQEKTTETLSTTTPPATIAEVGENGSDLGDDAEVKKDDLNQAGKSGKRPWKHFQRQRRVCYFCAAGVYQIDYKDYELLSKYINSYCKIMPRRQTRCCNKHQGYLANAIKRARIVGLLPFIKSE